MENLRMAFGVVAHHALISPLPFAAPRRASREVARR